MIIKLFSSLLFQSNLSSLKITNSPSYFQQTLLSFYIFHYIFKVIVTVTIFGSINITHTHGSVSEQRSPRKETCKSNRKSSLYNSDDELWAKNVNCCFPVTILRQYKEVTWPWLDQEMVIYEPRERSVNQLSALTIDITQAPATELLTSTLATSLINNGLHLVISRYTL